MQQKPGKHSHGVHLPSFLYFLILIMFLYWLVLGIYKCEDFLFIPAPEWCAQLDK